MIESKQILSCTARRVDFPILHQEVHGYPLAYLDNAATTHKPQVVINTVDAYYKEINSNVHRGVHTLSQRATKAFDDARSIVQRYINAASFREVIFTRGTTEAINLVANSFGNSMLGVDDEIILTGMEHHSNIVPWQMLRERIGIHIRVVPVLDNGELDMEAFRAMLNSRTKLVSCMHISNALGTINPIAEIIAMAHGVGAKVMIDAAQSIAHTKIDVQELDCDFLAFSGHKAYGPTGIGVLYGKQETLNAMPPFMGGGDMISSVSFERTTYNELPYKFEAGTPAIAQAIGLGAALEYILDCGFENIQSTEQALLNYATEQFSTVKELRIIGTAAEKASVVSFVLDGIHPHDVGTVLDQRGVAIRAGHHCAQPLMQRFRVPATNRASFALYNTFEEVDACVQAIRECIEFFK